MVRKATTKSTMTAMAAVRFACARGTLVRFVRVARVHLAFDD